MPTLLFVTYGGGHVNMIIPILQRLAGRPEVHCVTLGLTTAAAQLAQHGLPSIGFASLLEEGDSLARQWGERLCAGMEPSGPVNREESLAYLGLSYVDLVEQVGEEAAAQRFAQVGRQAFLPLSPLRRLFDRVCPDLVVATISPRAEQAAMMVARERGVPSLCLLDSFGLPSLRRASEADYGSRVCVLSDWVRSWLLDAGRRPDEVVVTGNPAFDSLGDPALPSRAAAMRAAKGWGGKPVILWASQIEPERNPFTGVEGDPQLPAQIEQRLVEIVLGRGDWQLVIRRHPNEAPRPLPSDPRVEFSDRDENLHTLLQAVDMVVTMTSTVGIEARLLGKQLLTVDLSVYSADTPFAESGMSLGVTALNQLEEAIEQLLEKEGDCDRLALPHIGTASDAVIAQIDELLAADNSQS